MSSENVDHDITYANNLCTQFDTVVLLQVAITSDLVQSLSYLDMCLNETLRMYPSALR